jgi:HicA toxin of bacterial toxin-antitoxin,
MNADLNNHHRDTIEKILSHPASGNVEWRQVLSLLGAIGATVAEHNGKVKVTLGHETEVMHPPHGKDIDRQMVVDLRRMLKDAGFGPSGTSPVRDERTRDRGDGRWGEPS